MKRGLQALCLGIALICVVFTIGCGKGGTSGTELSGQQFLMTEGPAIKQSAQAYLSCLSRGKIAESKQYLSSGFRDSTLPSRVIATLQFRDFGGDIFNPNASDTALYDFVISEDGITQESPALAYVTAVYSGSDGSRMYLNFTFVKETRWLIDAMDSSIRGNDLYTLPTESPVTPVTAADLVGTWKLIKASRAYNDPVTWDVQPTPLGSTTTQVFNASGTGHYTGYTLGGGSGVWTQADTIDSDVDNTWTLSGNTLTLQDVNPPRTHSYQVGLTIEGYLQKIQTTADGTWYWIMQKI